MMSTIAASLSERIKAEARALGFDLVGIAPVRRSDHGEFYRRWLAAGRHGEMAYLAREDAVARRLDPAAAWPELRSAVVVGHNYFPGGAGEGKFEREARERGVRAAGADAPASAREGDAAADPARAVIARYARGRDYHKVMKKKLLALLRWIEGEVGRELPAARAYVDTGPVLERELARRAGLGWFGQNTLLIHPRRGSYFFLGSLLLELELECDAPFEADRCGTCSACVDACPTGALLGRDADGAPVIDATRCISYLTIENRGPIPRELRPAIGNRIFGCDICQEVCPWNGPKFVQLTREPAFAARRPGEPPQAVEHLDGDAWHPGPDSALLVELMAMDEAAWESFSRGSPIRRAKRAGFLRNVAVALGNWGSPEAVPVLVRALADPEPLVRGHAAWALGRIDSPEARDALSSRIPVEADAWVREELELALSG
ncbi:MAG TPA: tRNA epoxyqueuosine(34) reductase QueG [Longimicrobiales bacterium]